MLVDANVATDLSKQTISEVHLQTLHNQTFVFLLEASGTSLEESSQIYTVPTGATKKCVSGLDIYTDFSHLCGPLYDAVGCLGPNQSSLLCRKNKLFLFGCVQHMIVKHLEIKAYLFCYIFIITK